jgi:hypothetical protein
MFIGMTGHTNIEKVKGKKIAGIGDTYDIESYESILIEIEKVLHNIATDYGIDFNNLTLVSGMARGIDEIFAEIAVRNNLDLVLSIPNSIYWHKNRDLSRGVRAQAIQYDRYLKYANTVSIIEVKKNYNGKEYQFANFARNQNIIDESNLVISYKAYDSTGTDDAIKAAKASGKYFGNVPDILKAVL